MKPPDEPVAGAGTLSVADAARAPAETERAGRARRARPSGRARRWPARRPRARSGRSREQRLTLAVVALSAALGAVVADVSPSGHAVADRLWAAALAGVVAAAASAAKRWTWFVAAGAGLALARDGVAIVCGAASLLLALASTDPLRPHPARGAAVGGLAAVALMRATGPDVTGGASILVAAALVPLLASGYRHAARRTRRRVRRVLVAAAVVVALVGGLYAVSAAGARSAAERGQDRLDAGVAAAREGDDATATRELDAAADAFADAERTLGSPLAVPAGWLPVVGHNSHAAEVMASAAADVSREGATTALGARAEELTMQGGVLDLARVQALEEPFGRVAATLGTWAPRLDAADSAWLAPPVADTLDEVTTTLDDVRPDVDVAAEAVRFVPEMFGVDGERRWFVAFVTPVEARGRTGLMGNFAELTATGGRVEMTRFGRASELEQGGTPSAERTLDGPADYLERWGRFSPASTWRNITMSPDFPSVARVMAELYPQSGGQEVDGVIAVDPVGLAALLELTGPVTVPGIDRELNSGNAAQFLLRDQYVELPDNPERTDALETLSRATFDRLTTGNLPGPGTIADVLAAPAADGHLHMWAADEGQQRLVERVGLDGALPPARAGADYIAVVSNNAVGNKVDLFLSRHVSYDATWDPDTGEVSATATVTLTNDAPTSGLPRYVIGSPLDDPPPAGTNRTYVSVYTPWEATGVTVDGEPAAVERQEEGGYAAYSLFLDVPPAGGTRTVALELTGALAPGDRYHLAAGTQPLVTPDTFDLTLDVAGRDPVRFRGRGVPEGRPVTASVPLHKESTPFEVSTS